MIFLLARDGSVEVCGAVEETHCVVPVLTMGVIYTCILATQGETAVLSRSDGAAEICGSPFGGLLVLPLLPEGTTYVRAVGYVILMRCCVLWMETKCVEFMLVHQILFLIFGVHL